MGFIFVLSFLLLGQTHGTVFLSDLRIALSLVKRSSGRALGGSLHFLNSGQCFEQVPELLARPTVLLEELAVLGGLSLGLF